MCCDGSVICHDLLTPLRLSNPHGGYGRNTRKHLIMVTKDDVAGQGAGHVEGGLDHDDIMTWQGKVLGMWRGDWIMMTSWCGRARCWTCGEGTGSWWHHDVAGQGAGHVERGLDHDDIMMWQGKVLDMWKGDWIMMTSWRGNVSQITGPLCCPVDSPHKGPVIRNFEIYVSVVWKSYFEKQSTCRWILTPGRLCAAA